MTGTPQLDRISEPIPFPNAIGTMPRIAAMLVIRIGRNLFFTAARIASGGSILLTDDVAAAAAGADVIYTDVWVSMGEPDEVWQQRIDDLLPYQVNAKAMALAGAQRKFMHCLPAFHDLGTGIGQKIHEKYGREAMEVSDEVFESPASIVFDEAENRMHTIKAVMAATLCKDL